MNHATRGHDAFVGSRFRGSCDRDALAGVLAAHAAAPNSVACRWLRDLRNPCEHSVGREQLSLEVIDVAAVARLLRVGWNTVYALVGRTEIPHRRVGKQIRFHRAAVVRWLAPWSLQVAKERQ